LYYEDEFGIINLLVGTSKKVPENLDVARVEQFYKYNSGQRQFNEIRGVRGFTVTVDAVVLKN
jgi:hypothetical protein